MISLHALAEQAAAERNAARRASTPPTQVRQSAGYRTARDLVHEALIFHGVPAAEIRAAVIVGSHDGLVVMTLLEQCPALAGVLVLDTEPGSTARLLRHVTSDAQIKLDTCFVSEDLADWCDVPDAVYRELQEFVFEVGVAPGALLIVADPVQADNREHAHVVTVVQDLCRHFSHDYLQRLALSPTPDTFALRGFADFLFEVEDFYHALKLYQFLPDVRRDHELIQRVLQCWANLSCPDRAQVWLQEADFSDEARQHFASAVVPAAREQALSARQLLLRNLEALRQASGSDLAALAAVDCADVHVVVLPDVPWLLEYTANGAKVHRRNYPLVVRVRGNQLSELNPTPDLLDVHRTLSLDRNKSNERAKDHLYFGSFIRHSALWLNLVSLSSVVQLHGWKRIMYLVEPDNAALLRWLGAVDVGDLVEAGQLRLFTGSNAEDDFVKFFRDNPNHVVNGLRIGLRPHVTRALSYVMSQLTERASFLAVELEQRYRAAPERLLGLLTGRESRPLRVVVLTSIYTTVLQYVAEDVCQAFEELGHSCKLLRENAPGEELRKSSIAEVLHAFDPDIAFMIDHTRPEQGTLLPAGLPVITWILDELPCLKDRTFVAQLGPLDLAYGFNRGIQRSFKELGYPFVGHLPFAANPRRYTSLAAHDALASVVYPTHVPEYHGDLPFAKGMKQWVEEQLLLLPAIPLELHKLEPIVEAAAVRFNVKMDAARREQIQFWSLHVARRLDRVRVAQAVVQAGVPIALYGSGWNTVEGLESCACGVAQPGEQLSSIYRNHKVVLHINRGCNIHPRVLEGFAAGGFVIARRDPVDDLPGETADQFEIGREFCLFADEAEMLALIRRAFSDEPWRRSVIEAAQARILRSHTYVQRMQVVLADLREVLETYCRTRAAS